MNKILKVRSINRTKEIPIPETVLTNIGDETIYLYGYGMVEDENTGKTRMVLLDKDGKTIDD